MHINSLILFAAGIAAPIRVLGRAVVEPPATYPTTSPSELEALTGSHNYQAPGYPIAGDQDSGHDDDKEDTEVTVSDNLQARDGRKGIYICNKTDFRGNCWWAPQKDRGLCQNWDQIRSFGPDKNGVFCDLFVGENCKGEMVEKFVSWPGLRDTRRGGLKSFRCGVL